MPVDTSDEEIEINNKNIVTNPLSEYCNAFGTEQDLEIENRNHNQNNKATKNKSKSTENNTDNYCEIYDDIVTDQRQDTFQTNNVIYSSKKELDQKPSIANYSNTEVRVSSSSSADQIGKQKMTTTNLNYSKTNNNSLINNGSINEYENPLDLLPPNSPGVRSNSDGEQSNNNNNNDNEQIKVKKHTVTSTLGSLNDASQSSREGNYSSQGFHEIMAEEYCQVSDGNFQNNQDI